MKPSQTKEAFKRYVRKHVFNTKEGSNERLQKKQKQQTKPSKTWKTNNKMANVIPITKLH